jgi:saccharopine dehydrogenase-like NADP-dependent oxidoreductase
MEFLKELLPPPSSLGAGYTGKTSIGVIFTGTKEAEKKRHFIWNVCHHEHCSEETGAQAVSAVLSPAARQTMAQGCNRQNEKYTGLS